MTAKDKELIEKAWGIHCTQWYMIEGMIDEAESDEAKERLRVIAVSKYHREEAMAGCL
ncbi:MAG: hypothetical protein IKU25_00255 [Clostridia bacterium]|nr:hypothetical protein [Clostridia bacterium]